MINRCSFDEEQIYVYGSLVPDNTGSIQWLDKNSEVVSRTDRFFSSKYLSCLNNILKVYKFVLMHLRKLYRSTKKRENEEKPLISDKDTLELSIVDTAKKPKMSKKQKVREES